MNPRRRRHLRIRRARRGFFTDYPIHELGDEPYAPAPIRPCELLSYDGDKYAQVLVGGVIVGVKRGYVYPPGAPYVDPTRRFTLKAGKAYLRRKGDWTLVDLDDEARTSAKPSGECTIEGIKCVDFVDSRGWEWAQPSTVVRRLG